jgi:hypothetical protein
VKIVDSARLTAVLKLTSDQDCKQALAPAEAVQFVQMRLQAARGFPPYALFNEQLSQWQSDWGAVENKVIQQALQSCAAYQISSRQGAWWSLWQTSETAVLPADVVQIKGRVAGNR